MWLIWKELTGKLLGRKRCKEVRKSMSKVLVLRLGRSLEGLARVVIMTHDLWYHSSYSLSIDKLEFRVLVVGRFEIPGILLRPIDEVGSLVEGDVSTARAYVLGVWRNFRLRREVKTGH
jgi:hypothetical protein